MRRPSPRTRRAASPLGEGHDRATFTVVLDASARPGIGSVAGRVRGEKFETTGEEAASLSNRYSVTLMVTMEQAAAIELAVDTGMPRLALRPSGDQDIQPFAGLTMAQLRGEVFGDPWEVAQTTPVVVDPIPPITPATQPTDQASAEVKPRPRPHVIEVIRGGVVTRTEMPARATRAAERESANDENRPGRQ